MSVNGVKDIINAELEGRTRTYTWRKALSAAVGTACWFDVCMSPGMPLAKYWFDSTPGIAKSISQSTDGGIYHGANVSPYKKYIRTFTAFTPTAGAVPCTIKLCDYLLYYPSIDEGNTDPQILDNTITLPRYTDGKGLQILPITVGARSVRGSFYVTYTNSDGISDRISQTVTLNLDSIGSAAASANVALNYLGASDPNGSANPFIGLQHGDSGVRSIQSVTVINAADGLFSLLIVKPLANTMIIGIDAPVEKDFILAQEDLPRIYDDAYINMICSPATTLNSAILIGDLKVCWCY